MNRPARTLWGLLTVGGATAVGVTTRDAGFTVITLVGGLMLPRILGFRRHGGWHRAWAGGCAGRQARRERMEERLAEWHKQAHAETV